MVDGPTPPVPPGSGPGGPSDPSGPAGPSGAAGADPTKGKLPGKGFHAKPMVWMKMHFNSDQATKLWQIIIQTVNTQIGKDKAKALKALQKMKKSAAGEDDSD